MAFSRAFLDEVRDRNDIYDVISRYVALKRAGSNYNGLCPFHSEKTPSFTVFPSTRTFYCFGCGAGGDVVSFVMRAEGLEYPDAIRFLADRAGIPMEEDESKQHGVSVRRDRVIAATTDAARFYRDRLFSDEGAIARDYIQKRGYTPLTVKRFGLGYAPDRWTALTDHLKAKGYTDDELIASFLSARSKKNGNLYDIFRNRLVIPIMSVQGEVVAFSCRRLNENDDRKYINTSDTPAFKKSKLLFGLNIAKNSTDGKLILCEGAVDAIALHQAGFGNAVATLGTAITAEHARLIARYAKTVYICYDMDAAGTGAKLKAIKILDEAGVKSEIISLSADTKDPDEFIKKYGSAAFANKLNASVGQVDFRIDQIISKYDISSPDDKLRAVDELTSLIASLESRIEREVYSSRIAERMSLTPKALSDEAERKHSRIQTSRAKKASAEILRASEGYGDRVNPDRLKYSSEALLEQTLLGMMLLIPELGTVGVDIIKDGDIATEFGKRVYDTFREDFKAGREVILSRDGVFTPAEISEITRYIANRRAMGSNNAETLRATVMKLRDLRERRAADEAIATDGAAALQAYIDKKRKK